MEQNSSIELKLISCRDLRAFNFFQKLTVYALVFIASEDPKKTLNEEQKQTQRTKTNRESDDDGSNPEWNHEARFDLRFLSQRHSVVDDLFFHFEFRHDGVILGDKIIGECRVPIADLIREADGAARFVSYEVRSGDGKPNGIFNFSYKLKGIENYSSQILDGRISGYPVLAPEDCAMNLSQVQYPTCEIENACNYPTVTLPVESAIYPPVVAPPGPRPPVLSSSSGEWHYCYPSPPPPAGCPYPPPPLPAACPYPPPPPPTACPYPPPPVVQSYHPFRPEARPWPPGPYFEHRW